MDHLVKFTTCLSRIRQIPEDLYCMYGVFGLTQKETFGKSWKKSARFWWEWYVFAIPKELQVYEPR